MVHGAAPAKRPAAPALSKATPQQLVQTLSNPKGWWRDTAQRLLVERGDATVAPALKTLAASAPDWRTKLHALWTLDGLGAIEVASVQKALADANADVRAAGVRLSERWLGQDAALEATVLKLLDDKNWNVRRQVAASIGEMPAADRVGPGDDAAHARRQGPDHRRRDDQQLEGARSGRADGGDAGEDRGVSVADRVGGDADGGGGQERRRGRGAARDRRHRRRLAAGVAAAGAVAGVWMPGCRPLARPRREDVGTAAVVAAVACPG